MYHSVLAPLRAVTTPEMFHVKHLRSNTLRRCCSLFCEMDTLLLSRLSFELKELGIWSYRSGAKQPLKAPDVSRETFLHSTSLSLRIKFSLSRRITVSLNDTPQSACPSLISDQKGRKTSASQSKLDREPPTKHRLWKMILPIRSAPPRRPNTPQTSQ